MNEQDAIPDGLKDQIGKLCDQQRDGLTQIVQTIIAQRIETSPPADAEAQEERRTLDRIMRKAYISTSEAAVLLGCSAQHLRNLVDRALKGQTETPIPFCDLDGPVTFPVGELLEWVRMPKTRSKKGGGRKTHLKAVGTGK